MAVINKLHYDLAQHRSEFLLALPFPYLVLDEFLNTEYFDKLSGVLFDIEKRDHAEGRSFNSDVEHGKWISLNSSLPFLVKEIIDELNSDAWVLNLRSLTGIETLQPTRVGNTKLANYHVMKPGGKLGSHVDHAADPDTGLPHVLNHIIYLSNAWQTEFGGGTEFFDSSGHKIIRRVDYKPNRCVIFLHTPYSFHGVEKISDRVGFSRKSIYVDYYSTSLNPYSNIELPFPNKWFYHPTTFILEPFMRYFAPRSFGYLKSFVAYNLEKIKSRFSRWA